MSHGEALARVEGLTIRFAGRLSAAVDSVTFEVRPGECLALVGESGSGKSLTAKALLGLLPQSAQMSGAIWHRGQAAPLRGAAAWNAVRGKHVGLVPQDALGSLDPLRRVEHEVGDSLRLHKIAQGSARRQRVTEALGQAGMPQPPQQLRKRSDQLSGGLRQRALVASALIADPELIIADEPTTALDAGHRARVLQQLRARVADGAGVVLISHDLASVRTIADRVLVMRDGRIIEQGTPAQVLQHPTHEFTRELIEASPVGKTRSRVDAGHTVPQHTTPGTDPANTAEVPARLELRGVAASYRSRGQQHQVLHEVSLQVRAGETVGLVGESGSGKTTLLRVALGLHTPEAGQVLVDGVNRYSAQRALERQLRGRIALVPQDPLDSFPSGAVASAILFDALRAAGCARRDRSTRARSLAAEVGLDPELLSQPAATLSGGQRQRLAIARALARNPELLLLDEPVSALDLTVQARVLELLNEVQARRGTALLLVSHDQDVISFMSDRVLRLDSGTVHAE